MRKVEFQVDDKGKPTAVVVPVKGHERLVEEILEDVYGHRVINQRRGEKMISKDELLKRLRRNGRL